MLRMLSIILAMSAGPAGLAAGVNPAVIKVDCSAGDDLAKELIKAQENKGQPVVVMTAQPVVIEISGVCETNLDVTRDNLTLRGDGTAVLRGPVGGEDNVVKVSDSRNVVIENLSVEAVHSVGYGKAILEISDSELALRNIEISSDSDALANWAIRMDRSEVAVADATLDLIGPTGSSIVAFGTKLDMARVQIVSLTPEIAVLESTASVTSVELHAAAGSSYEPYLAAIRSSLQAKDVEMDPRGNLRSWSRSIVSFSNSTPEMAPDLDVGATENSYVGLYGKTHPEIVSFYDSKGEIHDADEVSLNRFSDLYISGDVGSLFVRNFARALIATYGTAEIATCETMGEVVCPAGSVGSSSCSGCVGGSTLSPEDINPPAALDLDALMDELQSRMEMFAGEVSQASDLGTTE